MTNPYPKMIIDEASGIEVPREEYENWEEATKAALKEVERNLSALLKDSTDLRDLEYKLVEYVEALRREMPI